MDSFPSDLKLQILKKGMLTNKDALVYCLQDIEQEANWVTIKNYQGDDFGELVNEKVSQMVEKGGSYQLLKIIVAKLKDSEEVMEKAIEVGDARLVKYILK